eukprot:scaffold18974_cov132-Skeletonema_marinoi.AAC.3
MDRAINESINQRNKTIHLISSHLPSGKGSARLSKIQTHAEKEAFGSRFSNWLMLVPLMQSVHSHSASGFAQTATNDCLHFCMNSASVVGLEGAVLGGTL